MNHDLAQKLSLARDLAAVIDKMSRQGENYFLVKQTYNKLIGKYHLPLPGIQYISNFHYELIIAKKDEF